MSKVFDRRRPAFLLAAVAVLSTALIGASRLGASTPTCNVRIAPSGRTGNSPCSSTNNVRTGKLRIVFRGLAFIGLDSEEALRAALAASRQNRLWDIVDTLYHRQGAENSGWVTDQMLEEIAGARAVAESDTPRVDRLLAEARRQAEAAGISGTPAFQVGRTGGALQHVHLESLEPEGLRPAIEAALAA